MSDHASSPARFRWMLVVAVLGTAVLWLAALDLVLVGREALRLWPEAAVVARVVLRAALRIAREWGPLLAAGLVLSLAAPALVASLSTLRRGAGGGRRMRHV